MKKNPKIKSVIISNFWKFISRWWNIGNSMFILNVKPKRNFKITKWKFQKIRCIY